ncbi:MAG: aminodeoxychorismate synthase component I [Paludibacter sp.]|nr:aminodeoxychorismate synthase component I [Paludibacter sp.]MDD4198339.1 aminodeoxychorismate synthase component I [Paludibacter sp.]MDD4428080.1 aminodeoxychorismate synthase component I [Paludibacter sp.]
MPEKCFPYKILAADEIKSSMNELGGSALPFLFIINYAADAGFVVKNEELDDRFVRFFFHHFPSDKRVIPDFLWQTYPVSKASYGEKFNHVKNQIHLGNSFLINLTQPTRISTNLSLEEIYNIASAPYKLWLKDRFLVLSPETFIQIHKGEIKTFPMKGTIDATLPDAERKILQDEKEMAEHATIVDLLRNDLSMVAENVRVTRYRYVERINTIQKDLLQVSSEITGRLPENYHDQLGDILFKLLPAGSICGAPKAKTLEIIRQAEDYDRGFYTGVCGYFDGENLDSAVMIRFMEQTDNGLVYKSGGGITFQSELDKEYEELIQKVYVPVS